MGSVAEWLRSMLVGLLWAAGDASSDSYEKKIEVVDPDPVHDLPYLRCAAKLTFGLQAPKL